MKVVLWLIFVPEAGGTSFLYWAGNDAHDISIIWQLYGNCIAIMHTRYGYSCNEASAAQYIIVIT